LEIQITPVHPATAAMAPKHGRAGWIGERAQGNEDAGATVVAVVFEALAQ